MLSTTIILNATFQNCVNVTRKVCKRTQNTVTGVGLLRVEKAQLVYLSMDKLPPIRLGVDVYGKGRLSYTAQVTVDIFKGTICT